jgi:glutathione S-transferase
VDRIVELWNEALRASGGPYLFGKKPCVADAFYAPVVSRFRTYSIPLKGAAQAYCDTVWAWPDLQDWVAAARAETLRAKFHED